MDTSEPVAVEYEAVENLLLDAKNPRLASVRFESSQPSQDDLLGRLWEHMHVEELLLSISANGFFPGEPLLAIPGPGRDKWVVVEGNRRLAAVLLLREPSRRTELQVDAPEGWNQEDVTRLQRLPVVRYASRRDVWAVCGVRHVNGPRRWEAIDKAQYIAAVHEQMGVPVAEIIRKIGDEFSTVKRMYNGYLVLREAESRDVWHRENQNRRGRFEFSWLYTAVSQPEYRNFIDWQDDTPEPVPDDHLPQLKELLGWMYGDKSDDLMPVVGNQNPDINRLRDVLAKPLALSALRSSGSLDVAHARTVEDEARLAEALAGAEESLKSARGVVETGYDGGAEAYDLALKCQRLVRVILEDMDRMRREA
ncbi:MAG: hypothetical protein IT204_20715 [Fimbriimonadaceae bacterium]|nr:hypothetical protein [Fimbriimonadaceae bacterium]